MPFLNTSFESEAPILNCVWHLLLSSWDEILAEFWCLSRLNPGSGILDSFYRRGIRHARTTKHGFLLYSSTRVMWESQHPRDGNLDRDSMTDESITGIALDRGYGYLHHTIFFSSHNLPMHTIESSPSSFFPCHKATCCSVQHLLPSKSLGLVNPAFPAQSPLKHQAQEDLETHKNVASTHSYPLLPSSSVTMDSLLGKMATRKHYRMLVASNLKSFLCFPGIRSSSSEFWRILVE
jgi:hypothetical protein